MKAFLSKYKWKLLLAFAIFIVAIPFGINSLFKLTSPLNIFIAEWGAGDALAFYGVMLASATTIIGVYISIEYAQRNYRIDEANRVKPYLALTHYKSHSKTNLFSGFAPSQTGKSIGEQDQGTSAYEEYRLEKVYIIINQATIEYRDRLSDAQQQRLKSGGFEWCNQGGGCHTLQARSFVSVPFEVENVGNGAATNTMVAFYKKGEKRRGVSLYTIKQGDSFYFHIFCDDANIVKGHDYIIELLYGDIIGNYYSQKYPVVFDEDAEMKRFCTTVDLSGKQELTDMNTEEEENG
ncbi:MAG: hypothetical protein ACLSDA_05865 [[Eubacterium] siraeum]|jgi:hypothetical protein